MDRERSIKVVDITLRDMPFKDGRPTYEEIRSGRHNFVMIDETAPLPPQGENVERVIYYAHNIRVKLDSVERWYYIRRDDYGVFNDLLKISSDIIEQRMRHAYDQGVGLGLRQGVDGALKAVEELPWQVRLHYLFTKLLPFRSHTQLKLHLARNED